MSSDTKLVWLITGCSTGIGKTLALEVLRQGNIVIAAGRNTDRLSDIVNAGGIAIKIDPVDSLATIKQTVDEAIKKTGGNIDVLVNNAGVVQMGVLEELTDEQVLASFTGNVFGAIKTTQAVLPYMRAKRHGNIVFLGSVASYRRSPGCPLYNSAKFAVSGLAEGLSLDLEHLGIRTIVIEPGVFRTSLLSSDTMPRFDSHMEDYDPIYKMQQKVKDMSGNQEGDPLKLSKLLIDIISHSPSLGNVPEKAVRIPIGRDAYDIVKTKLTSQLSDLEGWKGPITSTSFDN